MATVINGTTGIDKVQDGSVQEADLGFTLPEGLGDGQAWQDVSASRVFGTTYTNNTGRTIVISIIGSNNSGGSANHLMVAVDGFYVSRSNLTNATAYSEVSYTAIVPAGSTYIANNVYGTVNMSSWFELR